jgi:hypothetical protein
MDLLLYYVSSWKFKEVQEELKNKKLNSGGCGGFNGKEKRPALTNINIAICVHEYDSSFPPVAHPVDTKGYHEQVCAAVFHSYRFSERTKKKLWLIL